MPVCGRRTGRRAKPLRDGPFDTCLYNVPYLPRRTRPGHSQTTPSPAIRAQHCRPRPAQRRLPVRARPDPGSLASRQHALPRQTSSPCRPCHAVVQPQQPKPGPAEPYRPCRARRYPTMDGPSTPGLGGPRNTPHYHLSQPDLAGHAAPSSPSVTSASRAVRDCPSLTGQT